MKAYVVKCLVLHFEGIGINDLTEYIERSDCNNYATVNVYEIEELEIGKWSDNHPLNKLNVSEETLNQFRG